MKERRKRNTFSSLAEERWMLAGEGLQFDALAKKMGFDKHQGGGGGAAAPTTISGEVVSQASSIKEDSSLKEAPSAAAGSAATAAESAQLSSQRAEQQPSVNMKVVRSQVGNMIISKKVIYDDNENIIGKVSDKPSIPNFSFYSCDRGVTWKKVFFPEAVLKEGGAESIDAIRVGSATITTAESGWQFSTEDFGASWTKLKKGGKSTSDSRGAAGDSDKHGPAGHNGGSFKRRRRKPRRISLSVPDPIPLPPQAPSILRCVKFKVDGVDRTVKAHFLPPFASLFKAPQSEQKVKDKGLVLDYIRSVMRMEDVSYIPSGVASFTLNPWSNEPPKRGAKVPDDVGIHVCSICGRGRETDHTKCLKSFVMMSTVA